VWKTVLAIGILCAPQFAVLTFAGLFLHDRLHLDIPLISGVLFCIQISAVVTRIGSGKWTDKRGNRRTYLKGCALLAMVLFALLALVSATSSIHRPWLTWIALTSLVCAGVVISAWHGVGYTELATQAGPRKVGTALAMGNAAVFMILFLTPSLIPLVLGWFSWAAVWGLMALLCAVAFALLPAKSTGASLS
jgi:predicted MFS family arabinose efflux permease